MKNTFGQAVTLTIFGESHGPAVGVVLDGLAPGLPVDEECIRRQLARRRPTTALDTPRQEPDRYQILSGRVSGTHHRNAGGHRHPQRERAQRGLCLWAGAALPRGLCRLLQIPRL